MSENNFSQKAFLVSLILVAAFISLIILSFIGPFLSFDILSILHGSLLISIIIITVAGMFLSVKSIKEPNTVQKVIALMINFGLGGLCLLAMISNEFDIL